MNPEDMEYMIRECPCLKKTTQLHYFNAAGDEPGRYQVVCNRCGREGPDVAITYDRSPKHAAISAVQNWNESLPEFEGASAKKTCIFTCERCGVAFHVDLAMVPHIANAMLKGKPLICSACFDSRACLDHGMEVVKHGISWHTGVHCGETCRFWRERS